MIERDPEVKFFKKLLSEAPAVVWELFKAVPRIGLGVYAEIARELPMAPITYARKLQTDHPGGKGKFLEKVFIAVPVAAALGAFCFGQPAHTAILIGSFSWFAEGVILGPLTDYSYADFNS